MSAKPKTDKQKQTEALACAYLTVFSSDEGKRVLADLLAKYPPDRPRFDDGGVFNPDTHRAAFRDGQSSVTTEILGAIEAGKRVR